MCQIIVNKENTTMRYMRNIILSVAVLFLLGISSCVEPPTETTSPPADNILFPMAVGNYWIYETFDLRADGSKILESKRTDSVTVESIKNIAGEDAYKFVRYTGVTVGKAEYYREIFGQIFKLTHTDTFNLFFPDNVDIMNDEPQYLSLVDPYKSEWVGATGSASSTIEYLDSRFAEKQDYSCVVTSVVTCKFESKGIVEISGVSYKSTAYSLYPDMMINIPDFRRFVNDSIGEVDSEIFISSYENNKKIVTYTYAESVGIANMRFEPYQVNYYSTDKGTEYTAIRDKKYFNGINRELVRYFLVD